MARPETLFEAEYVCVATERKKRGYTTKCACPNCTDPQHKPGRPKTVEFPDLLKGAVGGSDVINNSKKD
jgi:hypothetical protein